MKLVIVKDYNELVSYSSNKVINLMKNKKKISMGFSTGSTPIGLYKELVRAYRKGEIDFSEVTSFNLDEYYPIKQSSTQSYFYFMHKHLFNKINLKKENINFLNGETKNVKRECQDYEKKINEIGIDIQLLGIGSEGHIAFDEKGTSFISLTHKIKLAESTIIDNSRFFKSKNEVPRFALTMGLKSVMKAKKIILLATGVHKAKVIKELVEGKINEDLPASILKKHKNCEIIIDEKAASMLTK